jgi:hypothetical protein
MKRIVTIPTLLVLLTLVSFSVHPYGVSREAHAQRPPLTVTISAVDGNNVPISNGGTTSSNIIKFTFTPSGGLPPYSWRICNVDGSISCVPPLDNFNQQFSGLTPGQHTLTLIVVDRLGTTTNTAIFSWTITSLTPIQATQQLIQLKQSMHLATAADIALDAQLNAAMILFQQNLNTAACGHLTGFTTAVQSFSQAGLLTQTQASQLLQGAQSVESTAGC